MRRWHGSHPVIFGGCQLLRNKAFRNSWLPKEDLLFPSRWKSTVDISGIASHFIVQKEKRDYPKLDLNYQGIVFFCLSCQQVKYLSVFLQKLQCIVSLEPFSILLLQISCRKLLQDIFLLQVQKRATQIVYTLLFKWLAATWRPLSRCCVQLFNKVSTLWEWICTPVSLIEWKYPKLQSWHHYCSFFGLMI